MDWERKWIGDAGRGSEVRGSWVGGMVMAVVIRSSARLVALSVYPVE